MNVNKVESTSFRRMNCDRINLAALRMKISHLIIIKKREYIKIQIT